MTCVAIAREVGRSPRAVRIRLSRLGETDSSLGPKRKPGELMAAVRRLARRGYEDWETGYILNVSREAVFAARKRGGIPAANQAQSRRRKPVVEDVNQNRPDDLHRTTL